MTNQNPPQTWWEMMRQNFPLRQFIIGALIPIAIFYIFHRFGKPLTGALLAASWGAGVAAITHLFFKKVNLFAVISIPFTLIELAGTIITLNPEFYLASSAIDNTLWGLVYLGSILFGRPLVRIFAEAIGGLPKEKEFGEFGNSSLFRSTWVILTVIWGITHLVAAIILIVSQVYLPTETFLIIRTVVGMPKIAVLITFSFWFPMWYWNRSQIIVSDNPEIQQ
jgi:hypothetical protein